MEQQTVKRWELANDTEMIHGAQWVVAQCGARFYSADDYATLSAEVQSLRAERDAAKEIISRDAEFQQWAQEHLDSAKWAGHDRADAVKQELLAVEAERDRLNKALLAWEDREAAVCPEDVGFEEVIKALEAERDTLREALASNLDMIMVDSLRAWAHNLHTYGGHISHWGDPNFVGTEMNRIAADIEAAIKLASQPPVEQGEQPASDLPALREAFRAGFLAVHRAEGPYHMIRVWTFDGVAAADLEPEAWEAYKAQLAGLSRPEGTR